MKINQSMFLSVLFTILGMASVGHAQPVGDDLKPPKQFERFYAATVVDGGGSRERNLYIGEYDYSDVKGEGGFSGKAGILVTAVSLDVVPGYHASVCGTFASTKKYLCLPHVPGQSKLNMFSNVSKITLSKVRRDDEVVLWYNTFPPTQRPIANVYQLGVSYTMAKPFPNPGRTWIPNGLWLRLCKSRTAGNRQCKTYTSDTGEIKGDFQVAEIGKGNPPPEPTRILSPVPRPESKPLPRPLP